ncbi:MAG: DUF2164 domain-containing protein [Gemmatimonadaceae bacterium]
MRDRPPIKLSPDARTRAIASVRRYFAEELDLDIGDLKAGGVLDFFVADVGPTIYNDAIADARSFFDERAADLAAICYQAEFSYWDTRSQRGSKRPK